jgi:aminopeptidase N
MRRRPVILAIVLVMSTALLAAPLGAAPVPTCDPGDPNAGALGIGDDYYPLYGNGGYDVEHYDLAIRYRPKTHAIRAVATIDAVATQNLSCFSLDLVGLEVTDVTVGGDPATWARLDDELVITPTSLLPATSSFTVVIAYEGVPVTFVDVWGFPGAFVPTKDGAITFGEPEGAAMWFPVNDHPVDRATYTFRITVPTGYRVVANGIREGVTKQGRWKTHTWQADDPMVSYLVTVDIGDWDLRFGETSSGLPVIDAVDPDLQGVADDSLARQPEMVEFLEGYFGPYPFGSVGAIVADSRKLGYALETQTRPIYPGNVFGFPWSDSIVVHELAHQWLGDLVAIERWRDIWLNEGFATYAEWLWDEHEGGSTPAEAFVATWESIPAGRPFWNVVIGDPGIEHLFAGAVYVRGAMTLQALRNEVGDAVFWAIVSEWLETNAHSTGSTTEFMALAEQVSGQELSDLFALWLFTPGRPPASAVTGGTRMTSAQSGVALPAIAWIRAFEER